MFIRQVLVAASAVALSAGCGGDPETGHPTESPKPAPASEVIREPYELSCRDLREPAASRQAIGFVADVVAAPDGHSRRETQALVRGSLEKTCALPSLPNVDDPADYRPVRPVRQAVQNHFDQEVIYGH